MFKKFSVKEDISVINTMKSSVYRGIRNTLVEQHAALADVIDEVLPKKAEAMLGKGTKHNQFLIVDNEIRFYCERDGVWMPTLKLVHRCESTLKRREEKKIQN
jgi:PUA domain protein